MAGSSPTRFTHRENRLRINYLDDHRCWKSRTKCAAANIEKIRVFEGFFVIRSIAVKMCAYRRVKPGHDGGSHRQTRAIIPTDRQRHHRARRLTLNRHRQEMLGATLALALDQ